MDGHGGAVAALSSPSPGSSPKLAMSVSPSLEAGGGSPCSTSGTLPARLPRVSGGGDELQARLQGLHLAQRTASADGGSATASAASSSMATAGGAEDDDFGDFEVRSAWPTDCLVWQLGLAHAWSASASLLHVIDNRHALWPLLPTGGVRSTRGGGSSGDQRRRPT